MHSKRFGCGEFIVIHNAAVSVREIIAIRWCNKTKQVVAIVRGGRVVETGWQDYAAFLAFIAPKPKAFRGTESVL